MAHEYRYFPRNPDGTLKHKDPCKTKGCSYPNEHICLVGKPDTTPAILRERARNQRGQHLGPRSDAHREAISLAQKLRWEKIREANRERDQKIVDRYRDGRVSLAMLREEFGIGTRLISNVLQAAANKGEIVMRKPGHTLARGAR